ncbi:hypothetical protein EMCRGX_G021668 [Ephydatia muelleri]
MAMVQAQQGGAGVVFGEKHNTKPFHATIRRPLGLRAVLPANAQQQPSVQQQRVTRSMAIPIPQQRPPDQCGVRNTQEEQSEEAEMMHIPEGEGEDMETDNDAIDVTKIMDKEDPFFCLEYAKDIYEHLRSLEVRYQLSADYFDVQHFIHPQMRAVVVDWMVCVQVKFQLLQDTLFLSVTLLDRFLAVHPILKEELQLVGITALLIASKYEEVCALQVDDLIYVTDNSYTASNVHAMESLMLKTLGYFLGTPTALCFLRWYSRVAQLSIEAHTMAKFLMELGIAQYFVHRYLPSMLAAAAICFSTRLLQNDSCKWTTNFEHFIGYTESDLRPCLRWLSRQVLAMPMARHQAVRKKYSDASLMGVAKTASLCGPLVRAMSRQ